MKSITYRWSVLFVILSLFSSVWNCVGLPEDNYEQWKPLLLKHRIKNKCEPSNKSNKIDISVSQGMILIKQNLQHYCDAKFRMTLEQKGNLLKIVQENTGEPVKCMCGYELEMEIPNLKDGTYQVEVWGVKSKYDSSTQLLGKKTVTLGTLENQAKLQHKVTEQCLQGSYQSGWENVGISASESTILIKQNLRHYCDAKFRMTLEQKGNLLKIVQENTGEPVKCMCGYGLEMTISNLKSGTYQVEVWGVKSKYDSSTQLLGKGSAKF